MCYYFKYYFTIKDKCKLRGLLKKRGPRQIPALLILNKNPETEIVLYQ